MTIDPTKIAVFYIAKGKSYIQEASLSFSSFKDNHPHDPFVGWLFTPDRDINKDHYSFDHYKLLGKEPHEWWYLSHTSYMVNALAELELEGYTHCIFFDTDTYVCKPIDDIFDMMEVFDFMGAHAPGRKTSPSIDRVPVGFPEINIGFNPMCIESAIPMWADMYKRFRDNTDKYENNDQGPLRDVLWRYFVEDKIKIYTLPPEYNCRFNFPCFASGDVKILHGHAENIADIAAKVNARGGMRSWEKIDR